MSKLIEFTDLHFRMFRPDTRSILRLLSGDRGVELYSGLNLSLEKGKNYLITGDNGAGKTTLFRLAAGVLQPQRGTIDCDADLAICLAKSVIFFPRLSLIDNLRFASAVLLKRSISDAEIKRVVSFSGIDLDLSTVCRGLSSGMSARLLIALFVKSGFKHIVFDETFAHVQQSFVDHVVAECKKNNISLIIVSHTVQQFSRLPHEVIVIKPKQLS